MDREQLLKRVEFSVSMQNGQGILGKHPDYIDEKYHASDGSGALLDDNDKGIFDEWKRRWLRE